MEHPILQEIRSIDTSRRALRNFGLVVGAVLAAIAGYLVWRAAGDVSTAAAVLGGAGLGLVLSGLAVPAALRPLYRVWMALAVVLGFVMTRVLLTLVFYLAVVPIGLLLRLFGKDPLNRTIDPAAPTYWMPKQYIDDSPKRLEKYY